MRKLIEISVFLILIACGGCDSNVRTGTPDDVVIAPSSDRGVDASLSASKDKPDLLILTVTNASGRTAHVTEIGDHIPWLTLYVIQDDLTIKLYGKYQWNIMLHAMIIPYERPIAPGQSIQYSLDLTSDYLFRGQKLKEFAGLDKQYPVTMRVRIPNADSPGSKMEDIQSNSIYWDVKDGTSPGNP